MSSENDKIIRVNEFGNKKDTNNKTYDAVTKINGELTVFRWFRDNCFKRRYKTFL